jgi:hypothetical protein
MRHIRIGSLLSQNAQAFHVSLIEFAARRISGAVVLIDHKRIKEERPVQIDRCVNNQIPTGRIQPILGTTHQEYECDDEALSGVK